MGGCDTDGRVSMKKKKSNAQDTIYMVIVPNLIYMYIRCFEKCRKLPPHTTETNAFEWKWFPQNQSSKYNRPNRHNRYNRHNRHNRHIRVTVVCSIDGRAREGGGVPEHFESPVFCHYFNSFGSRRSRRCEWITSLLLSAHAINLGYNKRE